MRLVIQRVKEARVLIQDHIHSAIGPGLLVLLGIHKDDHVKNVNWLVNKLVNLRIFEDENYKMNRNLKDMNGEILVVSQFTLYGNCLNGRRPDFIQAAPPDIAQPLYNQFIEILRREVSSVQTGVFGAHMQLVLINDGPVTLILDSEKNVI